MPISALISTSDPFYPPIADQESLPCLTPSLTA